MPVVFVSLKNALCRDEAHRIEHTEYDAGAAEADGIEGRLHQAQEAALDETHGGCVVER